MVPRSRSLKAELTASNGEDNRVCRSLLSKLGVVVTAGASAVAAANKKFLMAPCLTASMILSAVRTAPWPQKPVVTLWPPLIPVAPERSAYPQLLSLLDNGAEVLLTVNVLVNEQALGMQQTSSVDAVLVSWDEVA